MEAYAWGWDELHRIEERMASVGDRILPGESLTAVVHHLENDPERSINGVDAFRRWLQELMDRTIAELDGTHFDIAEPVKRVEAMIAPPGGAAAMYYTRPSEDFKRPGRTWYPTLGKTRFPLWGEVSTAYHEGVPGHHLQLAQLTYRAAELSRFQRLAAAIPGCTEGWALYAERLMGELGYLEDPDYELGMLRAQAFRAMRVIVDIGVHLGLAIPSSEAYHGGETWRPELMLAFAVEHGHEPEDFLRSEVDRYLGWPGQAICYKLGERAWLGIREQARKRAGKTFDLENEAGSGGRGGVLVGQVSEARRIGQRVMKAIHEIAGPVAGGRRPLSCPHGVVRRLPQNASETRRAGTIAEGEQLGLDIELLGLLDRSDALRLVAGLEQQVQPGAGGRRELAAQVVDARGVAHSVDEVEAVRPNVVGGGIRDLRREAVARKEDSHRLRFRVLCQRHVDHALKLAAARGQHREEPVVVAVEDGV